MQLNLPSFSETIEKLSEAEAQLDVLMQDAWRRLDLALGVKDPVWRTSLSLVDEAFDEIHRFFSPISHLNAVKNSPEIREIYERALQKLSAFHTEFSQREDYYQLHVSIEAQLKTKALAPREKIQRHALGLALRDFRLSGVHLPEAKKKRLMAIEQELAELSSTFSNHVMDCTDAFEYVVTSPKTLTGLPESICQVAAAKAKAAGKDGWMFGLDAPTYLSVMQFAKNRSLRKTFYAAYATRASSAGSHNLQYDNQAVMEKILAFRLEKAKLLGFETYVDYSLASKMAPSADAVMSFLEDLLERSRPFAEKEFSELQAFASTQGLKGALAPWDVAYYSERYQEQHFQLDQQILRQFFPLSQVLSGLFELTEHLFGVTLTQKEVDVWHPDVAFYEIRARDTHDLVGGVYVDWFARERKRSGAWMDDYCGRVRNSRFELQYPVAFLTCNFEPPAEGKEATLTHDDVITLFHEFGHGLQHLLTRIDVPGVSGINGIPWDAVELPSQLMENFAFEPEVLAKITRHVDTGETLPASMFQQLLKLKQFQGGLQMLRQLEFALFDFKIHQTWPCDIQAILNEVRKRTALIAPPSYHRFQHAFSHIFGGGYAAGYYSYKWAEVLALDAYGRFQEEGVLNPLVGEAFRETVLGLGGSEDAMEVFKAFRGREPRIDALLISLGWS